MAKRGTRCESERELLDIARVYMSEAFPNPERVGCPGDEALRALAMEPMGSSRVIGEHVAVCSPCFKTYMVHLDRAYARGVQHQGNRRGLWIGGSAASLAAVMVLLVAGYRVLDTRHSKLLIAPEVTGSMVGTGGTAQLKTRLEIVVQLDLSSASPVRGAEETAGSPIQIVPSSSPVTLNMRLPFASEELVYSISVRTHRNVLWSGLARASRINGETLVTVHADFTHIPVGKYELQVASSGRRLTIPILITDQSSKTYVRKR